jgi:tetratricopeptide (TPR) repeat protein
MLHAITAAGPMQLVDEWPDRVFLREGYNEADVAARIAPFFGGVFESVVPGRKVVEIDRDEYLRVAVGLVTYDTPLLFEALFDHDPARYRDAAAQLAFGRALMAPGHDEIARLAAPYFRRAEAAAAQEGRDELARAAAAASYAAHAIAMLGQRDGAAVQAGQPFSDELLALHRRHGEPALLAALDVEVLICLGHAAGRAQSYDQAFAWLGLAIERNPFHDAAHWMRAKVRQFRGEPVEQVADATEALRRNQAWIDRRIAEHNARDPRDHAGHHDDLGRIAGLMTRRAEELTIRAGGLVQLGRLDEAEADLRETARLKPEDSRVAQLLAALPSLRDAFATHVAAQGREGSR